MISSSTSIFTVDWWLRKCSCYFGVSKDFWRKKEVSEMADYQKIRKLSMRIDKDLGGADMVSIVGHKFGGKQYPTLHSTKSFLMITHNIEHLKTLKIRWSHNNKSSSKRNSSSILASKMSWFWGNWIMNESSISTLFFTTRWKLIRMRSNHNCAVKEWY